jgi:hypothetical protein
MKNKKLNLILSFVLVLVTTILLHSNVSPTCVIDNNDLHTIFPYFDEISSNVWFESNNELLFRPVYREFLNKDLFCISSVLIIFILSIPIILFSIDRNKIFFRAPPVVKIW